jgi:hypothetical protein
MPEPKVYEFSKHICALCATRGTDVFSLGTKLGIDPMELLQADSLRGLKLPRRKRTDSSHRSGISNQMHIRLAPKST